MKTSFAATYVGATARNPSITSLPFEVLSRILTLVDGSDIPALKLTCKKISSVTTTRQFWYNRIDRLCKEHLVSRPEEELEEYTIAELEQWTLRRISVRSGISTKLKVRSRGDVRGLSGLKIFRLVPGCRWLLAVYKHFTVYCYDLDSSDLRWYLLLDLRDNNPSICEGNREIIGDHLWIDHEAPRLSFRFAASVTHFAEDARCFWVYIYQVDLIGHGADGNLVARIIATFQSPKKSGSFSLCTLNNRYFIQSRRNSPQRGRIELEIFDYQQALGCFDHPVLESHTFSVDGYLTDVECINKDVFAIHRLDDSFYHIFNIESSTSIKLLHVVHKHLLFCSRTVWTPEASLMTFIERLDRGEVPTLQGLVIPHDGRPPWTVELGGLVLRGNDILSLGTCISLTYDDTSVLSYTSHEWDYTSPTSSDPVPTLSTVEYYPGRLQNGFLAFYEDTGRSVHYDGRLYVIDIVPAD